ncbi:sensor domain-containing phosphodiesterase [Kluyvera sp. CHPC 1.251]|uniref:sensor domain-containing phosphodiesterase n=1 Tax=Kluyvera sp. CHPC 1.251 TaxID=2995175 RepID=UPI002FD81B44
METTTQNKALQIFQGWGLPLVLPGLLYPLAQQLSAYRSINGQFLQIYDLKLALITSVLVLFSYRAIPGLLLLIVSICFSKSINLSLDVVCQVVAAIISYSCCRLYTGRRSCASFWRIKITTYRIFWLCGVNVLLFIALHKLAARYGYVDSTLEPGGLKFVSIEMLISVQGIMNGCLTGIPMFYTLCRVVRRPKSFLAFIHLFCDSFRKSLSLWHFLIWAGLVLALMFCMNAPFNFNIFSTLYSFVLLFPLMLWSAVRIGHSFTWPIWTVMLIVLAKHNEHYILLDSGFMLHQALVSSAIFIFSLTILIMGVLARFNKLRFNQVMMLGLTDPTTGIPNLRALTSELKSITHATICLIQVPELELFCRRYGFHFRTRYQKGLAQHLRNQLHDDESIYYHAGYDLLLRLRDASPVRLINLHKVANAFRLYHNNQWLGFRSGLGYCAIASVNKDIYNLAGKLSIVSGLSLLNGRPENLEAQSSRALESSLVGKTDMRIRLQNALDHDTFVLMAQPIVSTHGDVRYHEILIRMVDDEGHLIFPDNFLPVAYEAGLAPDLDLWVIRHTLKVMQHQPDCCFSINLAPITVCRSGFITEVGPLFAEYQVAPERIIFEITEADILTDIVQSNETIQMLRALGCRVAIDDFGTGFASHARLMNVTADILKIDGSFIRDVTQSDICHYIVETFCRVAKMKNMQVVAEYVENAEIQACLEKMDVDWLQGYHVGRAVPLLSLK